MTTTREMESGAGGVDAPLSAADSTGGNLQILAGAAESRRRTVSGFAATLSSQIVSLVASVAVLSALVAFVPIESYALYTAVLGVSALMGGMVLTPVMALVVEDVTRARQQGPRILSMAWGGLLVGWWAVLVLTLTVVWLLLPDDAVVIAAVVVFADLVVAMIQVLASHDQVAVGLEHAAKVRVAAQVLRAAVLAVALLVTRDLVISLLCTVPAMLAVVAVAGGRYKSSFAHPILPDRSFVKRGGFYLLGDSSGQLQEDFDKTVLERYHPGVPTAVYALSFRLLQIAAVPIYSLSGTFQSKFVSRVEDPRTFERQVVRLTRIAFVYAVAAYSGLVALAYLTTRMFASRFGTDPVLLVVLALTLPIRAFVPLAQNALIAVERRGTRVVSRLAAALVSTALYFLLIPDHGWRGAVIGTIVGELLVATVTWFGLLTALRRLRASRDGAPT